MLWTSVMERKIQTFYCNHLLPEVIDPRKGRGMPIRGVKVKSDKTTSDSSESTEQQKAIDLGDMEDTFIDGKDYDNTTNDVKEKRYRLKLVC